MKPKRKKRAQKPVSKKRAKKPAPKKRTKKRASPKTRIVWGPKRSPTPLQEAKQILSPFPKSDRRFSLEDELFPGANDLMRRSSQPLGLPKTPEGWEEYARRPNAYAPSHPLPELPEAPWRRG